MNPAEQIRHFHNAGLRGLFERAVYAREFRSGIVKMTNRVRGKDSNIAVSIELAVEVYTMTKLSGNCLLASSTSMLVSP